MSTTAWLKNDQSVIQYFDATGRVGVANSNPAYQLDVNGDVMARNDLYLGTGNVQSALPIILNASSVYTKSNNVTGVAITGSNMGVMGNFSNMGNIITSGKLGVGVTNPSYAVEIAGALKLVNNGQTNHLWVSGGHFYTTYPMIMNAGQGSFIVRSNEIDCVNMSGSNVRILGNVWADSYSNLLIDSYNHSSTSNAPTNAALSNAFNMLQNANMINKYLDTSNAISITVNWQNASTNNAHYIVLESVQNIANQTAFGVRRKRIAISASNYGIAYDQMADTFGSLEAFKTLNLAVTASNSKSCTLTSTTNWVTTGTMAHSFSLELLSYPNVGKVSFL